MEYLVRPWQLRQFLPFTTTRDQISQQPDPTRYTGLVGIAVTPPDTMNAITSALSTASGSTALDGKISSEPAKLYDCGRYTVT